MASRQQRAQRKARQHNATVYRQGSRAIAKIARSIRDAKLVLLEELARGGSDWERHRIERILGALDEELAQVRSIGAGELNRAMQTSAQAGIDIVRDALAIRDGQLRIGAFSTPTQDFVRIAGQHSADLIQDITDDTRAAVNRILRRAALAEQTPTQVMRQIAPQVGRGVFARAEYRAELVTRTEMSRILNQSTQEQMRGFRDRGLLQQKQWVAVTDTRARLEHLAANGQVKPVEGYFEVGGDLLMFPGDQNGEPANTANCRCVSVPYVGVG